jgi:predicted kinase
MNTEQQMRRHASHAAAQSEIERRLIHACAALQQARCRLHQTHQAVMDAEEALMARKLEREAAVLRVAEMAEIVESLQRELERGADAADPGDSHSARMAPPEPESEYAGSAC